MIFIINTVSQRLTLPCFQEKNKSRVLIRVSYLRDTLLCRDKIVGCHGRQNSASSKDVHRTYLYVTSNSIEDFEDAIKDLGMRGLFVWV